MTKSTKYVILKVSFEDSQDFSQEKLEELFKNLAEQYSEQLDMRPIEVHDRFPLCS